MIAHLAAHLALRNRALSLTVATTGSASIAATATGFMRTTGSFLSDGFAVGMEVVSSGFSTSANNGNGVITSVTATVMLVSMFVVAVSNGVTTVTRPATVVEAEASGRTIAARLPSRRAFENNDFTRLSSIPFIEEDYVPATSSLSGTKNGGLVEETGLYVIRWYGLSGVGVSALRSSVDALKLLFAPGTNLTAGSHTVRVRTDTATQTGQILPIEGGWSVLTLTVPWWALSNNAIAA